MSIEKEHWHSRVLETKSGLFALLTTVVISVGGLVEVIPMYTSTYGVGSAEVDVYTPLELAGRDIYLREGCYNCHSQMIRPLRAETLRYGEWSRAGEYAHDRPFQLGSRRIGPDIARIGGKYPDAWHYQHMLDPRSTSEASIMPAYPWLITDRVDVDDITATVRAMQRLGEDYTDEEVANVGEQMREQGTAIAERVAQANIEGVTWDQEIIALIAYLQRLGIDLDQLQEDAS